MSDLPEAVRSAFRRAAERVPAYAALLAEQAVHPENVTTLEDFQRVPVTSKQNTFRRFPIQELCLDGELGRLGSVLTSSGHSGVFAFGLTDAAAAPATVKWIDDLLDTLFEVRSRPTLLINCLSMGVKVPTEACTLAETSVRPDMAVGLIKAFGSHFAQIVLLGDPAFTKLVLELGRAEGIEWRRHRVHVILGEETVPENARSYLEGLLGIDPSTPDAPLIISSMGVAELGLNLFFEAPPRRAIVSMRRALHRDPSLRRRFLGDATWVPCLFTYDPERVFIEFDDEQRLLVTTLSPWARVPLIRYLTGDRGSWVRLDGERESLLRSAGVPVEELVGLPLVFISGRGQHALAGDQPVFPEAVKEALYANPELAKQATMNFRLISGPERVHVRVQLERGVRRTEELERAFAAEIARYVTAPVQVSAEVYENFGDGMSLDYERKFAYLDNRSARLP